jgi:hypothetical protein
MVILNLNGETKERWQFDIEITNVEIKKDEREIRSEIAAIMRQITSSAGFLPLFNEKSMTQSD